MYFMSQRIKQKVYEQGPRPGKATQQKSLGWVSFINYKEFLNLVKEVLSSGRGSVNLL